MAKNMKNEELVATEELENTMKQGDTAPAVEPTNVPAVEAAGFDSMMGGALSVFGGGDDFFEEEMYLGDADSSRYPRLRLAQGLSAEVQDGTARPGEWVLEDHDAVKTVQLLITKRYANRMLLKKSDGGGRDAIQCRTDRVAVNKPIEALPLHGVGDPGIECATCPFSQWTERNDGSGKRNPPACLLIHTFEAISLTHAAHVEIQFKKTSERTMREMVKAMAKAGGSGKVVFEMTQEKQVNGAGQPYFVPAFKVVPVTQALVDRWNAIQAEL